MLLFKTRPKTTSKRSPGPGPIRKKDWLPVAKKHLKSRCVILHTDGARSYKLSQKLDGVYHDFVIHKKKKVKGRWLRPKYVKLCVHELPEGKTVFTTGSLWNEGRNSGPNTPRMPHGMFPVIREDRNCDDVGAALPQEAHRQKKRRGTPMRGAPRLLFPIKRRRRGTMRVYDAAVSATSMGTTILRSSLARAQQKRKRKKKTCF